MAQSLTLAGRSVSGRTAVAEWWHRTDPIVWPFALVRRLPFSLFMLVSITVAAYLTGSIHHGIPERSPVMKSYAYTLDGLRHGELYRLYTSEVMTRYPAHAWGEFWMLLCWLVPCELLVGTWRAMVTYWTGTLVGTFVSAVMSVVIFDPIGWRQYPDLIHNGDVGASVGMWTVAGTAAMILMLRGWWVWKVVGVVNLVGGLLYLVHILSMRQGLSDFGHPTGYAIGILFGLAFSRRIRVGPAVRPPAAPRG